MQYASKRIIKTFYNIKPTTAIILDTRTDKTDPNRKDIVFHPVKLRVTYKRESRVYGIGIDLTQDHWTKIYSPNLRDEELKEYKTKFSDNLVRANDIIKYMSNFSFESFKRKFKTGSTDPFSVYDAFDAYVAKLKKEKRYGSAGVYKSAKNSYKEFKSRLSFTEVTPDFLKEYEMWFLEKEGGISTVGSYAKCIRAVINEAIEQGTARRENYPFGRRKYIIPATRNIKKALNISQIAQVFNYSAIEGSLAEQARDFWIFTYLCNGMNTKDACKLKWKDLRWDKIVFTRAKTINTTRANPQPIILPVPDEAMYVIEKWGTKDREPDNYIFPFLVDAKDAEHEHKIIAQVNQNWRRGQKIIGKELNINLKPSAAKHSFSTVLKRSGASTEFIAEALGHSSTQVTKNYLDSFEDSVKMEFSKCLTSFMNPETLKKSA